MGIFVRGRRLWIRLKGADGKWTNQRTEFFVGQEHEAQRAFDALTRTIAAGVELFGHKAGAITLQEYCDTRFFPARRDLLDDWESDERRLELHVLPKLGVLALRDVRPRHLIGFFRELRAKGKLAPKSIYNVYGVVKALFREARIDDLIIESPCVLDEQHLGPNEDKDPEWRETATFSKAELVALISDRRLPADRHILYALKGLGALRNGEAVGLRWRHLEATATPGLLGKLVVARSHEKEHTKTKRARAMPVHPLLASMLAEWKLSGWPKMMGRLPTPDDLIVPMPAPTKGKGYRAPLGAIRTNSIVQKQFLKDLAMLGMRHRRGHDLRSALITLSQEDGAHQLILEACTHTPKSGKAISGYTRFSWSTRCAEVAKLQIRRPGEATPLPIAVGEGLVTSSLQRRLNVLKQQIDPTWRRRESNSRLQSSPLSTVEPRSADFVANSTDSESSRRVDEADRNTQSGPNCNDVTSESDGER